MGPGGSKGSCGQIGHPGRVGMAFSKTSVHEKTGPAPVAIPRFRYPGFSKRVLDSILACASSGRRRARRASRGVGKQVFVAHHHQVDTPTAFSPLFLYGKPGRIEALYEYPRLEVFRYMLVAMFRRATITVGTRAWLAGSASKHPLTIFSILRRAKSSLASAPRYFLTSAGASEIS